MLPRRSWDLKLLIIQSCNIYRSHSVDCLDSLQRYLNECEDGKSGTDQQSMQQWEVESPQQFLAKGPGQPAADLPAEENIPSRLDYGLLSEYERIRVCNVKKRDQLLLEIFGFKLDNEEQVTQTVHNFGSQLQNDMCNSGVKQPQEPTHRSTICAAEM